MHEGGDKHADIEGRERERDRLIQSEGTRGKLNDSSNNEWTGMVGALQSGEADLTVSELSITEERLKVVTYTQPIYIHK